MVFITCIAAIAVFICSLVGIRSSKAFSPERKMEGIEDVAQSFSEFRIPADVRAIGIGEATHGNREFQLAKKDVLEKVVSEGDGRCICFEMAVGEAAMINDAIHDENLDLTEALRKQSYPLYDTPEMVSLLQWMREFNGTVPYEESLMFYGVDIQGGMTSINYMQDLCNKGSEFFTEEEKEKLLSMKTDDKSDYAGERDFFIKLSERLGRADDYRSRQLSRVATCVVQHIDAPNYDEDSAAFSHNRDLRMAENLKAYSEIEEKRGYSQVIITAHNGHAMKGGTSVLPAKDAETMGDFVNNLFDGSYFCIGTEFYEGEVNIHTAGTYDDNYERANHFYCSEDPLAYQAQYFENGTYVLDFSRITDENSSVYKAVHSYIFNGLIGEGYAQIQDLYKDHRIKAIPSERFDAVIYFYEVTPIDPIHY